MLPILILGYGMGAHFRVEEAKLDEFFHKLSRQFVDSITDQHNTELVSRVLCVIFLSK